MRDIFFICASNANDRRTCASWNVHLALKFLQNLIFRDLEILMDDGTNMLIFMR